jgi:hypothetical protein
MGFLDKIFGNKETKAIVSESDNGITDPEIVAIGMALYQFFDEVHDNESNVITIKRIERRYSPWSSKIYGLNNLQR